MNYKLLGLLAFIIFICSENTRAQNNTSSPYSMFGIGEIESRTYGVNSGMAGTGIGLQLRNIMNNANPASLVSIDTLTFIFDVAGNAKQSYFKYGRQKDNSLDANLKKIGMGFRVKPWWGMNIGLRSFSSVGYNIYSESPIEGSTQTYTTLFEGSGGLSRLYASNSFKLNKNFSVGVTASFLFGTIEQTETQSQFTVENLSYARKFYFDFGAQYTNAISPTLQYTLGAVYGYKTNISLSNEQKVSYSGGGELENKTKKSTTTSIPQFFGAGASLVSTRNSRLLIFAADYMFKNWGAIKHPAPSVQYVNSHRVSAGMQYSPNFRLPKNYFQRMHYQLGASYELTNMKINGENLRDYAVTLGLNFPVNRSYVHFSTDFGYRTGQGLIKERYVMFTLGCSISEMWFFKRFYE